jgi:hypothetical protein
MKKCEEVATKVERPNMREPNHNKNRRGAQTAAMVHYDLRFIVCLLFGSVVPFIPSNLPIYSIR